MNLGGIGGPVSSRGIFLGVLGLGCLTFVYLVSLMMTFDGVWTSRRHFFENSLNDTADGTVIFNTATGEASTSQRNSSQVLTNPSKVHGVRPPARRSPTARVKVQPATATKLPNIPIAPPRLPIYDSSSSDDEPNMDFASLVARYTLKHNRPPPPRFNEWFQYAKENMCYLDRYDAIHRDLAPFLNLSTSEFKHRWKIATRAPSIERIVIRKGVPVIQYFDNPVLQYVIAAVVPPSL